MTDLRDLEKEDLQEQETISSKLQAPQPPSLVNEGSQIQTQMEEQPIIVFMPLASSQSHDCQSAPQPFAPPLSDSQPLFLPIFLPPKPFSSEQITFNDDQPIVEVAKSELIKDVLQYDLEQNLQLQIKARQNIVKLSSKETQLLPAMINLKTKELTQEQEASRSPIDLVCVIDISGSMCGQKIVLVRNTLLSLLNMLNQSDRLSLVQFDDKAERLTPLLRVTKENIVEFTNKINKLSPRGGTNIAAGADVAFKVLKERKASNPITSIFLLTDGLDPGATGRVTGCLKSRSLQEENFTIDCFGFGKDHDEELMVGISSSKNGSFYFIDKLETVDEPFAKAIGGLMSVVAMNVTIQVLNASYAPFQDIKIKRTFGEMWSKEGVTSGYKVRLNHMLAGSEKGYMLELEIPPTEVKVDDMQRTHCILDVEVTASDNKGEKVVRRTANLKLHLLNENELMNEIEEDGEVMENFFRVQGAEAIEEAIKLSNVGKYEEGSQRLESVVEQIVQSKSVNPKNIEPIMKQLLESKDNCKAHVFQASGKKYMMSGRTGFLSQTSSITTDPLAYTNSVQARLLTSAIISKIRTAPEPEVTVAAQKPAAQEVPKPRLDEV